MYLPYTNKVKDKYLFINLSDVGKLIYIHIRKNTIAVQRIIELKLITFLQASFTILVKNEDIKTIISFD